MKRKTGVILAWPPIIVLAIIVVAGQLLSGRYRPLSTTTTALLIILAAALEGYTFYEERHARVSRALFATIVVVGVVTSVEIDGVAHLITLLLFGGQQIRGSALLISGAYYWATNVLAFGLWFWLIDRGGPPTRSEAGTNGRADFFFPEMAAGSLVAGAWKPGIGSYMYLAFTNATAFSPTDTLPLSTRARALMTAESVLSLAIIALVMARAVNILK